MAKKFQKTVVVEAMRYAKPEDCTAIHEWMGQTEYLEDNLMCGGGAAIWISGEGDDMLEAELGDWIVKEDGKFYPCKPKEFKSKYKEADEDQ